MFTHDMDFLIEAEKIVNEGKEHFGLIYIHPKHVSIGRCVRGIKLIVDVLNREDMKNHIEFL